YHAAGDFVLRDGCVGLDGGECLTFGNIGVYDTALFRELPRGVKLKMLPLYRDWIARGLVSGERYDGPWANVGTPEDLAALDRTLTAHKAQRTLPEPKRTRCMTTNPLLDFSGLPSFDLIRASHVTEAVDVLLADARRTVEAVASRTAAPLWETV